MIMKGKNMIKMSTIEVNGKSLSIETGRIAKQASGSVVVTFGETVVLVTAVSTDEVREGIDFLPLSVEYQEMAVEDDAIVPALRASARAPHRGR